jgi:ribonucleases P/MRP protein subunit RPP40
MDLVLPQESYNALRERIVTNGTHPRYHRVNMTLEQLLQGEFFAKYIKSGRTRLLLVSFTAR